METCSSLLVGRDRPEVWDQDIRSAYGAKRRAPGGREGLGFRTGLASSQAVVKHPEQAVEQVAPHIDIAVTGLLAPVVVRPGAR
jgi:hypothetical protein